MRLFLLPLLFFVSLLTGLAQTKYPQDAFRSPLDFPLVLAGTFGELRSNHFHSGIDIKTKGSSGHAVHAIADGYVSRIKISHGGYGKALYVTHPNGYVSVFAHLSAYNGAIKTAVKNKQYQQESYTIEIFPEANTIPVKKGEIIAFTGNSGSSTAPHLHFEIRDARTQQTINPLLFGFKVADTSAPKMQELFVYELNPSNDAVCEVHKKVPLQKTGSATYKLAKNDTLLIPSYSGFALKTIDHQDAAPNKNGVYDIRLLIDDSLHYHYQMERFAFRETRYINSHMDYALKHKAKKKIHKSFLDPHNQLSIYKFVDENRGMIHFEDSEVHVVTYEVSDLHGNKTTLRFPVKQLQELAESKPNERAQLFQASRINDFHQEDFQIYLPAQSLYRSVYFDYEKTEAPNDCIAPLHHVHHEETALHKYAMMSMKIDSLPKDMRDKACIVRITDDQQKVYFGGEWKNHTLFAKVRNFGNYSACIDTIPPRVTYTSFKKQNNFSNSPKIRFKIADDLSGIKQYKGYIDGKWVLLEYDAKKAQLSHVFDGPAQNKNHTFTLVLIDNRNNKQTLEYNFVR